MASSLRAELESLANREKAKVLQRFFKTGKGEYGEGDIFLGVSVPDTRGAAKKFTHLTFAELEKHLASEIHEERLAALLILVEKFRKAPEIERKKIVDFYLSNTSRVNNWDLVDLSADKILGEFLADKHAAEKAVLYNLSKSKNLWERRISIVATFAFIKRKKLEGTFKISELLLNDRHDLIHKAVGWMLREAGKRGKQELVEFLEKHCGEIPRTMLRYAIEKFSEKEKKKFMRK